MHIRSPRFDEDDLYGFIHEVVEHEKARPLDGLSVPDRLERVSERLADLAAFVGSAGTTPEGEWAPREIVAHMVLVSQVFGWAAVAVGEGEQTAIDVLTFLRLRDPAGAGFAELPLDELVQIAIAEHEALVGYLRYASPEALARRATVYPFPMGPEQIALFHVCAHVEMHLAQLERALGAGAAGDSAAA
ncbi:MAG: DinB family protein [Actinomycetota bacterium]